MSVALRKMIFIVVSLICVNYSNAFNDMSVRVFDKREVLASSYTSFCVDKEGFLWVGTDSGLLRMDGNDCDIYRNDDMVAGSISDSKIVSLYCDSNGIVWIGTANGLNYYDRDSDSFKLIKIPELDLNGFIGQIFEDDQHRLLFLVGGIGVFTISSQKEKGSEQKAKRVNIGVSYDNSISHLINMGNGKLFVTFLYGEYGIAHPNGTFEKLGKLDTNLLWANIEMDGNVLLSSQYDIFRLNMRDRSISKLDVEGGEKIKITDIETTKDGTLFSTAWSGLFEAKRGSTTLRHSDRFYSSSIDFSTMNIGNVHYDTNGNLWLGCNSKGIAMLPSKKSAFLSIPLNKISKTGENADIRCINVVGNRLVIGLNSGNILITDKDGNLLKALETPEHSFACSIYPLSHNEALIGLAKGGIWSLDLNDHTFARVVAIDHPYAGMVLSRARNGDIIAGLSEAGILKFNSTTKEQTWYHAQEGSNLLTTSYYAGISRTSDGKIWIGGYSGLSCYDPIKGNLIPIDQTPFLDGVAHAICDTDDGCIFIGTGRGLVKYHPQKGIIKKYTIHDGLADNDVRSIVRDEKGGFWIGTLRGLSYMANEKQKIQSYRGDIGVSETSLVSSVMIINKDKIALGGQEGITFFNPDSVASTSFGAQIKISGMFLNGEKVTPISAHGGTKSIIEGNPYSPEALHLSYKDKSLVLRLSTMDFRDNSGVRYEWQLEGDGDNWNSTPLGQHFLYLPPLEPGSYTLRLRGWENEVCSDISEIKLDITPPWYLSNMAYSLYAILALIMIGLSYKVLRNKREEDLYETKIRYFMDISHELRSPITLMLNPVETLLKQNNSPETTSQLLTMRRNGQRVLNLVDQLLDLRKIEKGKMRLVFTEVDIKAFVEELVEMFRPMAQEKKQTISFVCDEKELWGKVDSNNLDKILVNLISNAIKYTPDGGEVEVCLRKFTDALGFQKYTVTVTDIGIGLDNKVISHLFERFYRNREFHHGNASGFGIGLDLCTRLVKLHKGEISAKNREDGIKGSIFSVTLPFTPANPGDKAIESVHRPLPDVVSGTASSIKPVKSGQRLRIMVVDDDEELREYIKVCLSASYKVVALPDAETALKELSEKLPDLIVTDVRMEGIDGIDLLRRIKSNMATHHIPVILFSSAAGNDERVKGWKSGADGYLAKPFTIDELEGMISGILSTRSKLKGKFSGSQDTVDKIIMPKVKGVDEELLHKINNYINENLSEPTMNVDGLSEYVGLSRSQLHRRMKDIIGVAPSDYIRNVKLRKACEMLSHGDVDIAQVAYSLGFNAQSHFSTLFKRYTGMTPSDYRNIGKDGYDREVSDSDKNGIS